MTIQQFFRPGSFRLLTITLIGLVAVPQIGCAQTRKANAAQKFATTGCDPSLWRRVYQPKRLGVMVDCITVTGTVEETSANEDGDQHFLLKLDAGYDALLNKVNRKKRNGDLVAEIVCANPASGRKPKEACAGYTNRIPLPRAGSHVKVTGTYVIDSHNGWTEIHPVSRLTLM
ncbi:MAG TPA: hypothetical protein VKO87_14955 [Gemmatimonadaceae bacterium]|nr:hypothetical protein [Gemmatimonadaceae bacterium]